VNPADARAAPARVAPTTPARPSLDLRLLPPALLAWAAAAWAVTAATAVVTAVLAAALVASLLGAVHLHRRGRGGVLLLAALAVVVVLGAALAQLAAARTGPVGGWAAQGATVDAVAQVRSDPRRVPALRPGGPERVVVDAELTRATARGRTASVATPVLVLADAADWRGADPGTRVRLRGTLAATGPGDRVRALLIVSRPPEPLRRSGTVARAAERLRAGLRAACAGLPKDARGLLPGLVVGDTSDLPPDLEAAMKAVGLTHLTAVSGSNTTLVVGALVAVAALLGAGRRSRLVLAGLGLAGFVVLARPEPSVLRAAVMGGIGLVGLFAGRPSRGAPVAFGAVVVLLVADPWLSRQYGFVLSVLATLALLLLARPWAERLVARGWPRWAAYALAVPTAAQAVCGPVVALLQPSVNLLAVPANVVVAPAVAPATVLGLAATVLAAVSPRAAAVLVWPAGLAAQWIAVVARRAAALPTAVPLPGGVRGAALLAVLTVLAVLVALAVPVLWRRLGPRRTVAALAVVVLLAVLLTRCTARGGAPAGPWPVPDWLVVGCDVGQGDAVVLRSGPRSAVLVDAGPDEELVDGCLDRLGVRRLDAVLLSHLHADHVDGAAGALRGRAVGPVWTSPLQPPGPVLEGLHAALAGTGADLGVLTTGATGHAGSVSWTVLWPPASVAGEVAPDSSEVNDSSLVLLADVSGVRVLLTGDVETAAQQRLVAGAAGWPGGPQVDVVKVAHHGSARQVPRLYELARPRVALVEVGAANDYGHPSAGALAILAAVGARTLRTDRDGDVAVAGTAEHLRTAVRGSDPRDAARRDRYGSG